MRQRRALRVISFSMVVILASSSTPRSAAQDSSSEAAVESNHAGQWVQFRGDRALSGRAMLSGVIQKPKVLWKRFIGGRETFLNVQFDRTTVQHSSLVLPTVDLESEKLSEIYSNWNLVTPELDPDAEPTNPPRSGTVGKFLKDRPGLQRLVFDRDENSQGYSLRCG